MQLNNYFVFLFFSYNKFIQKIELEHANRPFSNRPHSEVLSCQIRGRCELRNAPPQRHTTIINSKEKHRI